MIMIVNHGSGTWHCRTAVLCRSTQSISVQYHSVDWCILDIISSWLSIQIDISFVCWSVYSWQVSWWALPFLEWDPWKVLVSEVQGRRDPSRFRLNVNKLQPHKQHAKSWRSWHPSTPRSTTLTLLSVDTLHILLCIKIEHIWYTTRSTTISYHGIQSRHCYCCTELSEGNEHLCRSCMNYNFPQESLVTTVAEEAILHKNIAKTYCSETALNWAVF